MKRISYQLLIIFIILMFGYNLNASAQDLKSIFSTIDGWTKKGEPEIYTPDNLFEYINGAAEVFLSYDFEKLYSITFENKNKNSLTIDVYQHRSDINGFGIYSQEKPEKGNFISIGTQGYYEQGILNFLKGKFYVKISSFDLGDKDEKILKQVAQKIANGLDSAADFPKTIKCFPEKNKIAFSERYINKNYLGHSFLHSAFFSEYDINGERIQVFIIETQNSQQAQSVLKEYLSFILKKGITAKQERDIYRFQDPYYRSSGMMNLKIKKNFLWGLFSKDDKTAEKFISEIERNLKKHQKI